VRKGIVLGIAVVVGALAPAAAAAKPKPKPLPDLRITKIVIPDWDPFAYTAVSPDGHMQAFKVYVTTRNDGKAGTKKPSETLVFFRDSSGRYFQENINVPPLRKGKQFTKAVTFNAHNPALGFARLGAAADHGNKIRESSESDNFGPPGDDPFTSTHKGIKFAILAKIWRPADFETDANGFPAKLRTYNSGLYFELSSADKDGYTYLPWGSVSNSATATGLCSGTDSETRTHRPWARGDLRINSDLDGYYASVLMGPQESYSINLTCFGVGSHTENHDFLALETYAGERGAGVQLQMAQNAKRLQGTYTDSTLMTTWTWDLHADVP
jgi:CARDB